MQQNALIIGALGQIGSELIPLLQQKIGVEHVYCLDCAYNNSEDYAIKGDVLDEVLIQTIIKNNGITHIYHLAAILSAAGEKNPDKTWTVNLTGLRIILEAARKYNCKVFWPSSIAAFGPSTPKDSTPQFTIMDPTTIYGVTKLTGELLCQYYRDTYELDVRSVRFPGVISYKTLPGGGTSDFAVAVFHDALTKGSYQSFVSRETQIPMMYMPDALRAIVELMEAPRESLRIRTGYNVSGANFTAGELYDEIAKYTQLLVTHTPDFRQQIADSWPNTLDDTYAREDWGWHPEYTLPRLVEDMLTNIPHVKK